MPDQFRRPSYADPLLILAMDHRASFGRALFAVGLAALAALFVKLRGSGGTPPHHGGWREVAVTDLDNGGQTLE